jgi:tetratricopeptide (TPR) repeat protein
MHSYGLQVEEESPAPSLGRGRVWLQRLAGVALGGLAGTAAAYSPELWEAFVGGPSAPVAGEGERADRADRAPIPPVDAAESGRQITLMLITRARELIARGEIREAERFLAAAEKLDPDSPILAETRRLLDVAKAKIDLAKKAPATGNPPADRPPADRPPADRADADKTRPPATEPRRDSATATAADFAEGVKQFRLKNYNAALAAFGRAAAAGYAPAQNYLGYMYRHGFGVGQDYARAMTWYQKAAAQNHAGALNNIGYMHRHGLGVERDYNEARAWFRRAAERGDPAGQYNLGQMLADGVGATADYKEAAKWYRAAADQGHARAAMGLAHLFAQGLGVSADPAEAYFWYGVAARSGVEGAQRFRTALGAQLTAAQRQTADARLSTWKNPSGEGEAQ